VKPARPKTSAGKKEPKKEAKSFQAENAEPQPEAGTESEKRVPVEEVAALPNAVELAFYELGLRLSQCFILVPPEVGIREEGGGDRDFIAEEYSLDQIKSAFAKVVELTGPAGDYVGIGDRLIANCRSYWKSSSEENQQGRCFADFTSELRRYLSELKCLFDRLAMATKGGDDYRCLWYHVGALVADSQLESWQWPARAHWDDDVKLSLRIELLHDLARATGLDDVRKLEIILMPVTPWEKYQDDMGTFGWRINRKLYKYPSWSGLQEGLRRMHQQLETQRSSAPAGTANAPAACAFPEKQIEKGEEVIDWSAYMLMSELPWSLVGLDDYKKQAKFLDQHASEISIRKPRENRRMVHAADFLRACSKLKQSDSESKLKQSDSESEQSDEPSFSIAELLQRAQDVAQKRFEGRFSPGE
jgi:hypothetical protein